MCKWCKNGEKGTREWSMIATKLRQSITDDGDKRQNQNE